jgi:hypothetical protein
MRWSLFLALALAFPASAAARPATPDGARVTHGVVVRADHDAAHVVTTIRLANVANLTSVRATQGMCTAVVDGTNLVVRCWLGALASGRAATISLAASAAAGGAVEASAVSASASGAVETTIL